MDKHTGMKRISRTAAIGLAACALAFLLAACALPSANQSTDEEAAENRQYMAQLNQRTEELDEALGQFQDAVAQGDPVGMKAASDSATRIIAQVKESKATDALADVKEMYVAGLEELNAAMGDYADLYTQVAAGSITKAQFERNLKSVQSDYDHAIGRLEDADKKLTELANE